MIQPQHVPACCSHTITAANSWIFLGSLPLKVRLQLRLALLGTEVDVRGPLWQEHFKRPPPSHPQVYVSDTHMSQRAEEEAESGADDYAGL